MVIFKDGTEGRRDSEPVILQGHLDMVCEKLPTCKKDMEKEDIDLVTDGNLLRADGTTLGGDDGIAVAYILALLDADDVPHPPIEALLTTDEEAGLKGAHAFDASCLKGRRLINMDSEDEGVLTVSCAGASRIYCQIPAEAESAEGMLARKITAGGFLGGHSGIDINKNRKNAIKVLGDLLGQLQDEAKIRIARIKAGGRLNVITFHGEAILCMPPGSEAAFDRIVADADRALKEECAGYEPDAYIRAEPAEVPDKCAGKESTEKIIFVLTQAPSGVQAVNTKIPSLVRQSRRGGI